jgi:hypothetical protein
MSIRIVKVIRTVRVIRMVSIANLPLQCSLFATNGQHLLDESALLDFL